MIDDKRIKDATEKVIEAFGASLATSFPEAHSGDLSPETTIQFDEIAEQVVREWAKANACEDHLSRDGLGKRRQPKKVGL